MVIMALAAVVLIALVGFFGFTVRVNPDELGVVLRFGKYVRQLPPGLNFRWPYPIEEVELPKVTRINRIEIGMKPKRTSTRVKILPSGATLTRSAGATRGVLSMIRVSTTL